MTVRDLTARFSVRPASAFLLAMYFASVFGAMPALAARIANKVAVFQGLDKITGRTTAFDVYIDETVQFGALQVTPRVCYTRDDTEAPKTDAFVAVDEVTLNRKIKRIFTGWMFADSPGLNAIEHPVYDVWLKTCKMTSKVPAPDDTMAVGPQGSGEAETPKASTSENAGAGQ